MPRASAKPAIAKPNARRVQNAETVLDILRTHGPSSQASIARKAGLSPATVNTLIRFLEDSGSVEVRAINGREVEVSLNTGTGVYLVVEVGNDFMEGVAYSFADKLKFEETSLGVSNPAALIEMLNSLAIKTGRNLAQVNGVAIAMQAPLETVTHSIAKWCNLRMPGWADVDLQKWSTDVFADTPIVIENDSNLAALAEWTWGSGRGCDDFLYVRTSGGVGGGIVINGSIYHGGNGMAGDMGHVALEDNGEVCYCGSRGCLTTLISRQQILNSAKGLNGPRETIGHVVEAAEQGDAAAVRVLAEAGIYLGRAVANAAKILAPSVVSIGGDLGNAGSFVFESLMSSIEMSNIRAGSDLMAIQPGQLGDSVAKLGALAAVLAKQAKGFSELPEWIH